ncbi:MAG TPA: hypothetical protein VGH82_13715 [Gaiellaceae bacterium]|jgi:hypothetical protein
MKKVFLVGLLGSMALVLAACGQSGNHLGTVVASASKTATGSVWWDLNLDGATIFGTRAAVVGRGAAVFSRGVGYLAVDVPAAGGHPGGVEYILFTPNAVYLRPVDSALPRLPSGRNLIVAPLAASVEESVPGLVGRVEALDPELLVNEIASGAVSAVSRGTEVIDHLPLSKYDVTINLARARAHASGALRLAIADEQAAVGHGRSLAVTVWIDGTGRIARIQAAPPGAGVGSATFAISNYRVVHVVGLAMGIRFSTSVGPDLPQPSEALDIRALTHPQSSPLTGFAAR